MFVVLPLGDFKSFQQKFTGIKIASIDTMHMSWISGNLNELEDPIAKVNSWYICQWMPNQTAGEEFSGCIWSLYGLCMIAQMAGHFTTPPI